MVRKAGLLVLALAVVGLTSCSKNSTSPTNATSAEQTNVQLTIATAPEIASDGVFDAATPSGLSTRVGTGPLTGVEGEGGGGLPETSPGTTPTGRRWWRTISDATRSFDYEFSEPDNKGRPTKVHVTVHKHFTGTFHLTWGEVVTGSNGQDSTVMHEVSKPLADHWVRHLWLDRGPRVEGRDWHLVAASGVRVSSEVEDDARQPEIQSIRVQAEGVDSTFADPAAAIAWRKLWNAPPATPVTITVTTDAPDDVVVLMHHDSRTAMTANGDNTYTVTWTTPNQGGLKHFGVNALNPGTIGDDTTAYHSDAWLFPYVNRGEAYGS